ncbi:LysE family translocator [Marinomonas sp. 15G1-11]|uniref:LysE family translocator n=1 Tax=Marinomonas phaeophyticola TaxID=3004091 RepID=A0ABT4JU98_9GAMM|nr:LysE family translocator [Marinomonas sp. 15G1-11]MCZ2721607.1 LysE family translocator [Marinomonas sp. 15G1-11]
MEEINYALIMLAAFVAIASPGPSTLAISNMSMSQGRKHGVALATGTLTGSMFWSCLAALGFGTLLYANVWLLDVFRYFGACYLLYLSYKSMCSVLTTGSSDTVIKTKSGIKTAYLKGLFIHLSNPKPILFFGALYSLGVPNGATSIDIIKIMLSIGSLSVTVCLGYALLFSIPKVRHLYFRSRKIFESVFSIFFAGAGMKMLMSKLETE